jgi:hypothetical protein
MLFDGLGGEGNERRLPKGPTLFDGLGVKEMNAGCRNEPAQ